MKPTIIAIVGASGSGKTYLSKYLRSQFEIPVIVSTTTRPRRPDETEGVDYYFVRNTKQFRREDMLTYNCFGKYEYFALKSELPATGLCSYVVEENGVKALKQSAGRDYHVFTVLVTCDKDTLIGRGIEPERIERDRKRKAIGYDLVDLIIGNNGTIADFDKGACDIMKIIEQWLHLQ